MEIEHYPGMTEKALGKIRAEAVERWSLADTITRLAEAGADDFYNGKIARKIATDMAANGGYVTTEDLAAYKVLDGRNVRSEEHTSELQSR